ncbi:MAG TPA: cytochrome c [Verrucomicrobiae bacterium]|nr:cytochrome c [Verrucomicrobiae bacterium]
MQFRFRLLIAAALTMVCAACTSNRHSAAAFHLPPDGDIERGRQAFLDLGCNSCHSVAGADLPKPTVQPPVPVSLGGLVDSPLSDAYLATSIIYPSYDLAPYPKNQVTAGGKSRMPHYDERMTVRQLADIVTFLQSRYSIVRAPEAYR